jgi:anti-anti-sigma factor
MNLTLEHSDGHALVRLAGQFDSTVIDDFRQKTQTLVEQRHLLLDLSTMTYLNSEALGALIRLNTVAKKNSMRLVLISPNPAVRQVFLTTSMDRVLTIVDDHEQAVAALEEG